ncbi:MAG: hypothetical protein MI919_09910, partial [Holophagales bacterium]|nr:hypothetical protein [Holophagales bacterium]
MEKTLPAIESFELYVAELPFRLGSPEAVFRLSLVPKHRTNLSFFFGQRKVAPLEHCSRAPKAEVVSDFGEHASAHDKCWIAPTHASAGSEDKPERLFSALQPRLHPPGVPEAAEAA